MFRRPGAIERKSLEQLVKMRAAGLVVSDALQACTAAVRPGVTTAELDQVAADVIGAAGAEPSFLGYFGFPAVICVSVNDEVVHGIPGDRELVAGDLVSIDCGAIVSGWHGDAAVTVPVGEVAEELTALSEATRESLWEGICAAAVGGRLSNVGAAVEGSIREAGNEYGILRDYVGHGIGSQMHMAPSVANFGPPGKGPRLKSGMAIAIEPMVTLGSPEVSVLSDEWTVATDAGNPAAHWEHTIALTDRGPWVLTAPDGGAAELARRGIASPAQEWDGLR
ncbi:MAG: type I methionyl aminopeptidase [Actinomycetia bacterium]|nr:type I methionyl aminopeptidase [Actinomycetes bacterium]MCH9801725.1 type I methionyl aminopeptidase [Actinomycetes bacterium]